MCVMQVQRCTSRARCESESPKGRTDSTHTNTDTVNTDTVSVCSVTQEVGKILQLLPGKLSFVLFETEAQTKKAIMEQRNIYFFSSDFHEDYMPFFHDFGPVNLGVIYQFCKLVEGKILDPRLGNRMCTYYAESDGPRRTNAAFLLGAYLVIKHGWKPEEADQKLQEMGPGVLCGYKHALNYPSDFKLSVLDCLRGLKKALDAKWFDMETFDLDRYSLLGNPGQFDLHQICPKFVAFRGPDSRDVDARFHAPEHYCELFKSMGVAAVIRLSEEHIYDAVCFVKEGIIVHEVKLKAGEVPSKDDIKTFLEICDAQKQTIGVHCTGGRGRTATMIAIWMIKQGWRARDAIAWLRIVRPGSIHGPQQQFLDSLH